MSAWWFNWIQSHLSWANCHERYDLLWKNHLKDVDVYYWGSSVAVKVVFFWKCFFFHTIKVKSILGSRILKNTFFCLPQMKESYRDLEQMNWIIFFGWTITLNFGLFPHKAMWNIVHKSCGPFHILYFGALQPIITQFQYIQRSAEIYSSKIHILFVKKKVIQVWTNLKASKWLIMGELFL